MEIPKQENNSNDFCSVFGCNSLRRRDPNLSFHKFPKKGERKVKIATKLGEDNIDRLKAWIIKLKMGKPVTSNMLVCSLHFQTSDYFMSFAGVPNKRRCLKKDAVPSLKLPNDVDESTVEHGSCAQRMERLSLRNKVKEKEILPISEENCTCEEDDDITYTEEDLDVANTLLKLWDLPPVKKIDMCVQVTSGDFQIKPSFASIIMSDAQLNTLTGLSHIEELDALAKVIDLYYKVSRTHKLSTKEKIILSFMKLKQDLSYATLAIFFNISASICKTIFTNTISELGESLSNVIRWPEQHEIKSNLPLCFSRFEKTRIVLDCIEIPVQKPKCLCCRVKLYSHYKGRETVKFMTGVSPAGLITFVSFAYGGRASDKAIFEQSGLINKLSKCEDAIMVDKGFLVQDFTKEYGIELIRPNFLRCKENKFTETETRHNVSVAKARVHVERTNARIRVFKIFNSPLTWNLINVIDDIFVVVCAIVNLQTPILAIDKF